MPQVADEQRDRFVQSHRPRQVRHQRLQPFAGIVAKVMYFLPKKGNDLTLVFVRLFSEGLNDPQCVAQIELFKIVLVPVGLAILPQRLPAPLGVPSEHFQPFTDCHLLFGVEVTRVENVWCVLSDQPNVGVAEQTGQAEVIAVPLLWPSLNITLQFGDDPADGLLGLRQEVEVVGERKGFGPAIPLDGLHRLRHEGVVRAGRTVEVADRRVPNVQVGMQDGFLDLVFRVSHDALPVRDLTILFNYSSSSAYCGGLLPTFFVTLGNLPLGTLSSMASTLIWCHQSSPKSNQYPKRSPTVRPNDSMVVSSTRPIGGLGWSFWILMAFGKTYLRAFGSIGPLPNWNSYMCSSQRP